MVVNSFMALLANFNAFCNLKFLCPFVGAFEDAIINSFEQGVDHLHELLLGRLLAEFERNRRCNATTGLFDKRHTLARQLPFTVRLNFTSNAFDAGKIGTKQLLHFLPNRMHGLFVFVAAYLWFGKNAKPFYYRELGLI